MTDEDSSQEKDLIRTRGSIRGRMTNFGKYLEGLDTTSLSSTEVRELHLRLDKTDLLFDQFESCQSKLESLSNESDDTHLKARIEFEDRFYALVAKAQDILSHYAKADSDSESSTDTVKGSVNRRRTVRMPPIQLPKFNGSYENWLEFRDTFTSLVHQNRDYDNISKFHYLRSSLEGFASEVIKKVEFCSSNYLTAWDILCERYDNKRLLTNNHVSALFNIPQLTTESSTTLKNMVDLFTKHLRALTSLGEPTTNWDTLLIYLATQKLDTTTFRKWEECKTRFDKGVPILFNDFISFLKNRADFLESLELSRTEVNQTNQNKKSTNKSKNKALVSVQDNKNNSESISCPKCQGNHSLGNCPQFLALTNDARLKLMPTFKICFNCFRSGHFANRCNKPGCKVCKRKHNTVIHVANPPPREPQSEPSVPASPQQASRPSGDNTKPEVPQPSNIAMTASVCTPQQSEILLSTALVKLIDANNCEHIARALLDSGSTSCIMTEKMFNLLKLPSTRLNKSILGINDTTSHVSRLCRVTMKSLNDSFTTKMQCFVLQSITQDVPSRPVNILGLNLPTDLCIADPKFYLPAPIDLIIGADLFWDIIGAQHISLGKGKPILHETRLGWIISGPTSGFCNFNPKCNFAKIDDLQAQLTRFWEFDEVSHKSNYSYEERLCEEHFVKNTKRLDDGSFCVKIPLKESPSILGDSSQRAKKCFSFIERRLTGTFGSMYRDFMSDYKILGHMSETPQLNAGQNAYFIPHHGVLRESSTTTKLRVVFNASSPTTSGVSLNKIQMVGPTVQDDLLSILLRFRFHKYILSADVEKMYRTVWIHPDDRHLQQIFWRDSPSEEIKTFQLNTVTYGTASAPFLATRCLKEIGLNCKDKKVSDIITHDFYVDDLLTGCDDLTEAKRISKEVTSELASARMNLRKWKSNEPLLVTDSSQTLMNLNIGSNEPNKVLGLGWQASSDELHFPIGSITMPPKLSKRQILSVIAQIFDPLGLLSPCVVKMKILLQRLWLLKLSWDDQLPTEISQDWAKVIADLPDLINLRIPRIVVGEGHEILEFHIFTDASERAYGACLYVRTINANGEIVIRLLMAKSRVAPLKPTTIPRLELCGALLGTRIYEKAVRSLRFAVTASVFWSDSTVVLGWLKMQPNQLQTFVRNRVVDIQDTTKNCEWNYVPSEHNPADCVSRGVSLNSIRSNELYWSGPPFLKLSKSVWPKIPAIRSSNSLPEIRREISLHVTENNQSIATQLIDFNRFSNLNRLNRAVAYMLRFIKSTKGDSATTDYLTEPELRAALMLCVKTSQRETFPEYKLLAEKRNLPKKSPLSKFNAFLDENNVMRVGGRLVNSNYSFDKKHPIILQSTHRFTQLLFQYFHIKMMHAGPQLLLSSIREIYWPIGGRNLAKLCYHRCVQCTRAKGKIISPIMGNLPKERVVPGGYPFQTVGVDYAGPISCLSRQGRGSRVVKVYIAIFICFATKAMHLELVGDLSSNNFLLALRRFISRRGKPSDVYSDNGTSFVGAHNELSQFLKNNCNSFSEVAANEGLNFHFIPAYSPHFGGLWEAGVKSAKFHLQRVLGSCNLTYEELNTTLVQVEAILNSRPLTPLSSDPEDFTPLTPGHFIIGRPLTGLPVQDLHDCSVTHLNRFQRIEQLRQHIWSRWSAEYISELQLRTKWRTNKSPLKLNALVVIKDDQLPPLKWKMGRIIAVHPGPDGINRVADVRTPTGVIRRSFSKICPLPVPEDVSG